jgi:hypothetical protein
MEQSEAARILEERGKFIQECKEGKHTDHVMNALRLAAIDKRFKEALTQERPLEVITYGLCAVMQDADNVFKA